MPAKDGSDGVAYAVFYDGLFVARFRKGKWEKMTWKDVKPFLQGVFKYEPDGKTPLTASKFSAKPLTISQYKKSIKLHQKGQVITKSLDFMAIEDWLPLYNNMKKEGLKDG